MADILGRQARYLLQPFEGRISMTSSRRTAICSDRKSLRTYQPRQSSDQIPCSASRNSGSGFCERRTGIAACFGRQYVELGRSGRIDPRPGVAPTGVEEGERLFQGRASLAACGAVAVEASRIVVAVTLASVRLRFLSSHPSMKMPAVPMEPLV